MTGVAVFWLLVAVIVVWGGLGASAIFLALRPEVGEWPPGDEDPDDEEIPGSLD
jgi:hypothetical protein